MEIWRICYPKKDYCYRIFPFNHFNFRIWAKFHMLRKKTLVGPGRVGSGRVGLHMESSQDPRSLIGRSFRPTSLCVANLPSHCFALVSVARCEFGESWCCRSVAMACLALSLQPVNGPDVLLQTYVLFTLWWHCLFFTVCHVLLLLSTFSQDLDLTWSKSVDDDEVGFYD